ncbi:FAD-dependent oxidoreductase [Rhodobacterales bacterium FZCC0083]|nr:FAD-dependent oxidoreductase [Rhodobacterales bacterium FZCC0083]
MSEQSMKSQARVVIIGGGIFGASILYHLTKEGWTDCVLIEKGELSSGTTWHAAGQCPHFTGDLNMAKIQDYGIRLYKTLEEETGQATGWHTAGGIRLARHQEELDWHNHVAGIAKLAGYETHVVGLDEIRNIHPYLELHDVIGGTFTPHDGHTDPSSVTAALALGARNAGATIYRKTLVTEIERENNEWVVISDKGTIRCEHVVLATGFFSDKTGGMAGYKPPLVNIVHQYLITDPVPEVQALTKELPVVRDPGSCSYMRQERDGLLGGPYENAEICSAYDDGVPWSFDTDLLDPDLDRIAPWLEKMMERMPLFETAGVRRVISGFIAHAPDLNPLVGPVGGKPNLWMAAGSAIGVAQGPGFGKYLAQWMVHGEAEISMLSYDPRRYSDIVHTPDWIMDRTKEASMLMFDLHPPGYEYHSGRGLKTTPIYERQKEQGALFGESMGWERPKWFDKDGIGEELSFTRNSSFDSVAAECRAVRDSVGVFDLTSFTKIEASGHHAHEFLNRVLANNVPSKTGGLALCHLLNDNGVIEAEMTVTKLEDDTFFILSAGAMRARDFDQLQKLQTPYFDVEFKDVTDDFGCLAIAGPRSRDVLLKLTDADLSNDAFRWLTAQSIAVNGADVRALRVSYAGELGWEIYVSIDRMAALYNALMEAGAEFGIIPAGMYALNSLRMEKAYRGFGSEMTNEVTPIESDMMRFVSKKKSDFRGHKAIANNQTKLSNYELVYGAVDVPHLDIMGNEPLYSGDDIVGLTTSGGFGHCTGLNLTFAYVRSDAKETPLHIEMLGSKYSLKLLTEPAFDPENLRPRS